MSLAIRLTTNLVISGDLPIRSRPPVFLSINADHKVLSPSLSSLERHTTQTHPHTPADTQLSPPLHESRLFREPLVREVSGDSGHLAPYRCLNTAAT